MHILRALLLRSGGINGLDHQSHDFTRLELNLQLSSSEVRRFPPSVTLTGLVALGPTLLKLPSGNHDVLALAR